MEPINKLTSWRLFHLCAAFTFLGLILGGGLERYDDPTEEVIETGDHALLEIRIMLLEDYLVESREREKIIQATLELLIEGDRDLTEQLDYLYEYLAAAREEGY